MDRNLKCVSNTNHDVVVNEFLNNCKISNTFMSIGTIFTEHEYKVQVMNGVISTFKLKYEEQAVCLDRVDLSIMDAVYTLTKYGYTCITPSLVFRLLRGDVESSVTVSEKMQDLIKERINRLCNIIIEINCTEEFIKRYKLKNNKEPFIYKGPLLDLSECKVMMTNGRELDGYQINDVSALYKYAERIKQIICAPVDRNPINTGRRIDMEYILIQRYLTYRIELMKNKKNKIASNKIIYVKHQVGKDDGLVPAIGIDWVNFKNWNKKKSKIHATVRSILDGFIKQGYIE